MKNLIKLASIATACASLVACGGGQSGGGQALAPSMPLAMSPAALAPASVPAPAPVPVLTLDQVKANANISSIGGKQTVEFQGQTMYFYNGVQVSAYNYQQTNIANDMDVASINQKFASSVSIGQSDTNVLLDRGFKTNPNNVNESILWTDAEYIEEKQKRVLNKVSQLLGQSVARADLEAFYGDNASTATVNAFNADVQSAWNQGWYGSGFVGIAKNDADNASIKQALFTLITRVAPNVKVDTTEPANIVLSFGNTFNHNFGNLLPTSAVIVGSESNIASVPNNLKAAQYNNETLIVKEGSGSGQAYGVVGATQSAEAVAVAGGYASLLMHKFANLSGANAGSLLKQTAVTNASGGQDLSLRRAMSPTGNLK